MKKTILLALLLFTSIMAFSQAKFGVRAGINNAKITKSDGDGRTDFYAGVLLNVHISDLYELQPELIYSRQGGDYTRYIDSHYIHSNNASGHEKTTSSVELDYISIGFMNKFFIMKDEKLHLLIGPSIDFNFGYNLINIVNDADNVETDFTPIDLTFQVGAGYQFDFGLTVEARFKHGLLDVDLDSDYYNYETNKYESKTQLNSVFQLGASYKFDFSK